MAKCCTFRFFWLTLILMVCGVMLAGTLLSIREINLRSESNLAALWSGMLLLLIGLHAYDGFVGNRQASPRLARAWLTISVIMGLLSFDEVGSLHERLPSDTHGVYWLWVAPFALGFAAMGLYAVYTLLRSKPCRRAGVLIIIGFLLFVSVAVQEELEWRFEVPENLKPIRGAIEEGTELLGMFLVLLAAMQNTVGRFARVAAAGTSPVFEAVRCWRVPAILLGLVAGPLLAWWTINLGDNPWGHGLPVEWPPAAIFMLALFAVLRPFFAGAVGLRLTDWGLALLCLIGAAVTTLGTADGDALLPMTVIVVLSAILWLIDKRYTKQAGVWAALLLMVCLAVAWAMPGNAFIQYGLVLYASAGIYFVLSSPKAQTISPSQGAPPIEAQPA